MICQAFDKKSIFHDTITAFGKIINQLTNQLVVFFITKVQNGIVESQYLRLILNFIEKIVLIDHPINMWMIHNKLEIPCFGSLQFRAIPDLLKF